MNNNVHKIITLRTAVTALAVCIGLVATIALGTPSARAGEGQVGTIRFAVPPWPGVTVKCRIVADILDTLGYKTAFVNVGTALAFQGLANKDIDVYMGYWSPNQDGMADKYLKKHEIDYIADNVEKAKWGIGVPKYVWDSGVHSVEDLAKHKERFGGKLYAIEPGAALTKIFKKAVSDDVAGLGGWQVVTSSTAGMLSQVKRATSRKEWIAWGAWSPHWMMKAFNTKFLDNHTDAPLRNAVTIRTVVATDLHDVNPGAWQFLKQVKIPSATQSAWIYEYSYKHRKLNVVANEWIRKNMATIKQWLNGVKARDGRPAVKVVAEAFSGSG